jgi:hypothetical protein
VNWKTYTTYRQIPWVALLHSTPSRARNAWYNPHLWTLQQYWKQWLLDEVPDLIQDNNHLKITLLVHNNVAIIMITDLKSFFHASTGWMLIFWYSSYVYHTTQHVKCNYLIADTLDIITHNKASTHVSKWYSGYTYNLGGPLNSELQFQIRISPTDRIAPCRTVSPIPEKPEFW